MIPLVLAALAADAVFEISVPASVRAQPLTGRVYVMLSRSDKTEPRMQVGRTGVPFFGRDVEKLAPGATAKIDASDLGSPVESLREIPAGEYFVQAFVNVYSEFRRSDGHVLWMHNDQWEGQHWRISPGNLYSKPAKLKLDAAAGYRISLVADQIIPPIEVPANTEYVERFKFQSPSLSKFWGKPIYLGATVLLPEGYRRATTKYPVIYEQGHFSLGAPSGFGVTERGKQLEIDWKRADFPRMLVVTFQHPNPYFDDSYAVNSLNVGPYGDAIMNELIPEVEKRYRVIREPWARALTGGSTGGWESFALQVFHPDFFGGTWSYCPDSLDFRDVEGIDVYSDTNAFYKQKEWYRVPTINTREINGQVRLTSEQRNRFELVSGTKGRSGEQLDIWSAVFSPIGSDGYFKPLFDKRTGAIDKDVAKYWKENYDLRYYLERNWYTLGPKLVGKLHVYNGDADNFFLNNSTRMLDAWLKTTKDPHYEGYFVYGPEKGHCYVGPGSAGDRMKEIASHMLARKPADAGSSWWVH
jgi:hypothetical protein